MNLNPVPVLSQTCLVCQVIVIDLENVNKIRDYQLQEDGKWMYTGGEDCTAKIWDLRCDLNVGMIYFLIERLYWF